ncbi:MAG: hypothetical protein ACLUIX_10475 [Oscillospiraceae bacterium]
MGNYQTLLDAEAKLADLQSADAVEKLIDAMGTVTLDSEEAIKAARGAYDALTDEQKELVGNYQLCWTPRPSWLTCRCRRLRS